MEIKIKMKIGEKISIFPAHKYVGHAGVIQSGYVGGIHGIVAVDAWCCSCPS